MSLASTTAAPPGRLVEGLQAALGDARRVVAASASPSEYSSSFRIDDVTVGFEGAATVALVLKDLSWHTMLDGARAVRSRAGHDPTREIDVYRHVVAHGPPGPPALLGWVEDLAADRHWLLLEKVDGLQLRHVGDADAWRQSARWAGAFHARFSTAAARRAIGCALPAWTAERFRWSLAAARAQVRCHGDRRARAAIAAVERCHDTVVGRLTTAPVSVVHGELYPSNVVVSAGPPRRVSPLDWETAAVGPGVLDLAALTEGDWDEAARDDLAAAYLEGRDGTPERAALDDLRADLACARVHLCLELLRLPAAFDPPEDLSADWATLAAHLTEAVA